MENNRFDRFSDLWKKDDMANASQKIYSEDDIHTFKMKKSKDFSKALNTSIAFDFALKGLLVLGMLLLIWFYHINTPIVTILVLLIAASFYLMIKENSIRKEFKHIEDLSSELSTVLKSKIRFYNTSFPKLKWMLAFSNALFVWVGSAFYSYSKYGYYKIEDIADVIVTVIMLTLAFGISYFAMTFQFKFYIHELKECLTQLDDEQTATMTIKKQVWRKRVFILAVVLAVVVGVLTFAYILMT